MNYLLLDADIVMAIHDAVLNPGEMTGMAGTSRSTGPWRGSATVWSTG